ncbi:hypothetical protein [Saccharothrix xinjiangensis]|uniref:Copper(I)-binding protein n=1 Tax=Saccharothrix xinjiangensis TaxID=204798 RepID=A0ABV9XYK0_9PSEU
MNTAARLSAYGVALALVAGVGWAVGSAVGPLPVEAAGRDGADAAAGRDRGAPSRVARVDEYEVRLDGELEAGGASPVRLTVSRDGRPVTDLEPHLGSYGALVALRQEDLVSTHLRPRGRPGDGETPAGPELVFVAELPTAGAYRLFLNFRHGGAVRTAEFTATAGHAEGHDEGHEEGHGHG